MSRTVYKLSMVFTQLSNEESLFLTIDSSLAVSILLRREIMCGKKKKRVNKCSAVAVRGEWEFIIGLSAGWTPDNNPSLFDHHQCHHEQTGILIPI